MKERKKANKTIWLVEWSSTIVGAFPTKEAALIGAISRYKNWIKMEASCYGEDSKENLAFINTISDDLNNLITEDCIEEMCYIVPVEYFGGV